MLERNKVAKRAHDNAGRKVAFRGVCIDWSETEVFLATDSGHANVSDLVTQCNDEGEAVQLGVEPSRSQKSRAVGQSMPMMEDGGVNVRVMEWRSQVEKRVCRSTPTAETSALASGVEVADWMRVLSQESRDVDFNVAEWSERAKVKVAVRCEERLRQLGQGRSQSAGQARGH